MCEIDDLKSEIWILKLSEINQKLVIKNTDKFINNPFSKKVIEEIILT